MRQRQRQSHNPLNRILLFQRCANIKTLILFGFYTSTLCSYVYNSRFKAFYPHRENKSQKIKD